MTQGFVGGIPGMKAERSAAPRKVLASTQGARLFPGGKVVDGAKSRDVLNAGDANVLRAGVLMGKITASGKYAPSVLGALTEAYDHSAQANTTLTVSTATAGEIIRRIGSTGSITVTGPATAAGTVASETVAFSAVDAATGEITITAAANDFIAGSLVQPADGSEAPLGLLGDGYGLKVTDADGNSIDVPLSNLLVGGFVEAGAIVNYPADAALKAHVKSALRSVGMGWAFDDEF